MKRDDLYQSADQHESEGENSEEQESNLLETKTPQKKMFMPEDYNKAKRSLNKMITQYFTALKDEINKGAKMFLNRSKLPAIMNAISYYAGVRYGQKKQMLQINLKLEQTKKKQNRNGLFSYVSQCEKIINYNIDGKVNIIPLQKGNYKLPDLATPVPFQNYLFLLDPCKYQPKRKVFVPTQPALCISSEGKVKQISGPILFRTKCAIVRDKECIYLLGGYVGESKILTNRCQRFIANTGKFQEIESMKYKHRCPSACISGKHIWVFSASYIQYFDQEVWRDVSLPFGANFLPFQFIFPVNQSELLIFGGMHFNQKSCQLKMYNIKERFLINYGPILPQGICNQRSWGPCVVHGCIAVLSSIQASVYPQVGVKSSMSEVIYIHQSSAYLNCIINV